MKHWWVYSYIVYYFLFLILNWTRWPLWSFQFFFFLFHLLFVYMFACLFEDRISLCSSAVLELTTQTSQASNSKSCLLFSQLLELKVCATTLAWALQLLDGKETQKQRPNCPFFLLWLTCSKDLTFVWRFPSGSCCLDLFCLSLYLNPEVTTPKGQNAHRFTKLNKMKISADQSYDFFKNPLQSWPFDFTTVKVHY